jgi:Mg2+/Co2+ transporter CorC
MTKIEREDVLEKIIKFVDESFDNSPNRSVITWRVESLCQVRSLGEIQILCGRLNRYQNFYRFNAIDRTFVIEVLD